MKILIRASSSGTILDHWSSLSFMMVVFDGVAAYGMKEEEEVEDGS